MRTRPSNLEGRGSFLPVFVIICFLAALGVFLFIALNRVSGEDVREVRTYGDMVCVYNVTTDEIEECR